MNKIIYIASELFTESAGTPRQKRELNKITLLSSNFIIITRLNNKWIEIVSLQSYLYLINQLNNEKKNEFKTSINFNYLKKLNGIFRFFKQTLLLEYITLDMLRLYLILIKYILGNKNIEFHISSPPFPLYALIFILFRIPYKIDMRDPWALHKTISLIRSHRKLIEKKVLVNAYEVSVATKYMNKEIYNNYKIKSNVLYNIPDLESNDFIQLSINNRNFDPIFLGIKNNMNNIIFMYTGSVPDNFYDLNKIEDIFFKILSKNKNFYFIFLGMNYRFKNLEIFENTKNVLYLKKVSRNLSINYLRLTNYALYFGHKFDGYLTTKLFEYIALNLKIIPINLNKKYEAFDIIRNYNGISLEVNNSRDFISYLNEYK